MYIRVHNAFTCILSPASCSSRYISEIHMIDTRKTVLISLLFMLLLLASGKTASAQEGAAANEVESLAEEDEPLAWYSVGDVGFHLSGAGADYRALGDLGFYTGGDNFFTGVMGLTIIDDETYLTMRLQPELTFGKFGVGLDIPLMYGLESGKLRTEEFEDGVAALRIVRYLRYGRKKTDPVYIRLGDLNSSTLGAGFVVYRYANSFSFEKRTIGTEFDINHNNLYGIEGVYGDFSDPGLIALRPYFKPLALLDSTLPLLNRLEMGVLYATDVSDFATPGGESLSIWGADLSLPLYLGDILTVTPYLAWASIGSLEDDPILQSYAERVLDSPSFDPGSGSAIGVNLNFDFILNIFTLAAKLERRIYGKHFVGSYFNTVYELNKFDGKTTIDSILAGGDDAVDISTHPTARLVTADGDNGIYGAVYGQFLRKILIGGSLQIPDRKKVVDVPNSRTEAINNGATLHLEARAADLVSDISAGFSYDRNFIQDFDDAFALDERSVAQALIVKKLSDAWRVGLQYRWTFARVDGEVETTSYIFPYVGLHLEL